MGCGPLVAVLVAPLVLGASAGRAAASVSVERGEEGWSIAAEGARLEEVLEALAAKEGFDVRMQLGIERRPVDVHLTDVPLDTVLRRVLRRRSYTISYEETEDGLSVSRVTVLSPQDATVEASSKRKQPVVMTAAQRAAAARAAQAARLRAEAQRKAKERLERQRRQRAARLEKVREARRRAQARQAAAAQVPLRRALWARGQ